MIFVVVNGVPSVGIQVMCGSGKIETQNILPMQSLPLSNITQQQQKQNSGATTVVFAKSVLLCDEICGSRRLAYSELVELVLQHTYL